MDRILLLTVVACLGACSTIMSSYDNIDIIWKPGTNIKGVETPTGFTLSAAEAHSLIPRTIYLWSIYADDTYYYYHPVGSNYVFWGNSALAKKYNQKVLGTDRQLYLKLKELKAQKNRLDYLSLFNEMTLNPPKAFRSEQF